MNICVYGAASTAIDKKYIELTERLGERLAKDGHHLVYGAGDNGLMGAVARGFHKGGGNIIGVAPTFFKVDGVLFPHCTELIRTETMRQRKQIMEDKADAFIMVPGGIGTFDEFFEILTLKQLGRHTKPIIIYNQYGYYDSLLNLLDNTIKGRFMNERSRKLWGVFDNEEELIKYLDNYEPEEFDIYALKEIDKPMWRDEPKDA